MNLHLWFGLTGGIVILIVCFSGTIYVYNTELTEWASPELYKVSEQKTSQIPVEQLVTMVENQSEAKVTSMSIAADPSKSYILYTKKEGDKSKLGTSWFVNQYTGTIQGNGNDEGRVKAWMGNMFSLHRWLLFDKVEQPIIQGVENRQLGRYITGWATILFTLGCITGLIIWFPNKVRNWRQGLKIKTNGNWKRTNHDLHNTLAFYSFIFLLVMGLTGPQWSFEWYRNGLQKTLGTYKALTQANNIKENLKKDNPTKSSVESISPGTVLLTGVIAKANQELPFNGNMRITFPTKKEQSYSIIKTKTGFFAPAAGDKVTINASTGLTVKKDVFRDKPFNERVAGNIKALHVGTVFGGFTKLLYFISCLIATTLPVTGTLIWVNKLKKKRARKRKPAFTFAGKKMATA